MTPHHRNRAPRRRAALARRAGLAAFVSLSTTAGLTFGLASPAAADTTFRVEWTRIGIYPRSGPSMDSARFGTPALSDGTPISVRCEQEGQTVSSTAGTSPIWERLSDGSWLPNVFVFTGADSWSPGVPRCDAPPPAPAPGAGQQPPRQTYDRGAAVSWALQHVQDAERYHDSDCTWFVSQALWAGGLPRTGDWTDSSFDLFKLARKVDWPGPTKAAAQANAFKDTIVREGFATITEVAWSDNTAGGAQPGDVIAYDWNKGPNNRDKGSDGLVDHLAIVTSVNEHGYPSVSQHTSPRTNRYWSWDPAGDGSWIEYSYPTARVYLIHVTR